MELKDRLATHPILAIPESDRPYTVYSDFCGHSVSAVLEQHQSDNKNHVIAYASRSCTPRERILGSTDGELLALLYAITKFHTFLAGSPFTVVVDNAALQYLQSAKSTNNKLARWAIRLSAYDFKVKHRPGRHHGNVDGLSRAAQLPPAKLDFSFDTVATLQASSEQPAPPSPTSSTASAPEDDHPLVLLPVHDTTMPASLPLLAGPRQALLESSPCSACH